MKVTWHDFRSLVTKVHHIFQDERKAAAAAATAAAKPASDDQGGLHKLKLAYELEESQRKKKTEETHARWDKRRDDIDGRLKAAHDVLARALPADKEAAQLTVDTVQEEQLNFFAARAKEGAQLAEARADRKRKYESDCARQHVANVKKQGAARKKMKEALAPEEDEPMEVDVTTESDPSSSATNLTIGAAASARDPTVALAKATAAAAIAKALAIYNAGVEACYCAVAVGGVCGWCAARHII